MESGERKYIQITNALIGKNIFIVSFINNFFSPYRFHEK